MAELEETLTTESDTTTTETAVTPPAPDTSDVTINTEPGAEHMIPKSRFDAINDELKQIKSEQAKATKAAEEAQHKAAEEQGEYKKLYETERAQREAAVAEMKAISIKNLKHQIASETGLPNALSARLQGETEDEIRADAKELLSSLPKAGAPKLDGGVGGVRTDKPAYSDQQINEMAAQIGVSSDHLRTQLQPGA